MIADFIFIIRSYYVNLKMCNIIKKVTGLKEMLFFKILTTD
jgi:hypothetical protein